MVRLLRWGTLIVLLLVIIGAALSYPLVRDRFFGPMLAAPAQTVEVPASVDATITIPTAPSVKALSAPTARPTMPVGHASATIPALIIEAPTPTDLPQATSTDTASQQVSVTATPATIATTSLLPASSSNTSRSDTSANTIITPVVLGPTSSELNATTNSMASTTASFATATAIVTSGTMPTAAAATIGVATVEAASVVPPVSIEVSETIPLIPVPALIPVETVTPIVVSQIERTPPPATPTPQPVGPIANTASPLYSGPSLDSIIVGQTSVGEQLTVIGYYTEGEWYLLGNGHWLPGAVVDNAPLALPLVFPTMTPVPSSTPTATFTPLPTATLVGSPTPTPTATSLDEPVCDCSGDTLDCLGNIFANRAEAQQCFEYCFRQTGRDIHLLDPNLNGMACENLP